MSVGAGPKSRRESLIFDLVQQARVIVDDARPFQTFEIDDFPDSHD
jgi:hypothetical protein